MGMRQVALVTGAYGAIGKVIVWKLAQAGLEVVLAGRDEAKLAAARDEVAAKTPRSNLRITVTDVSRYAPIRELRAGWRGPLHALVNNAGTTPRARLETGEGIEAQWATNVLGYYRMLQAFGDVLAETAAESGGGARAVNVASSYAGGLDLQDPEFKRRPYDNNAAYRQSKQADRMLSAWFAEAWKDKGVKVVACHPGGVNSKLSNDLGFAGMTPPEQGADTPAWLAAGPDRDIASGSYYVRRRAEADPFAADKRELRALAELCAGYDRA